MDRDLRENIEYYTPHMSRTRSGGRGGDALAAAGTAGAAGGSHRAGDRGRRVQHGAFAGTRKGLHEINKGTSCKD